jgi:hypothetical protein
MKKQKKNLELIVNEEQGKFEKEQQEKVKTKKDIKVQLEGTPHVFDVEKVDGNETTFKCRNCSLEGIRTGNHKFIMVAGTRENKKLVESCEGITEEKKSVYKIQMQFRKKLNESELAEYSKKMAAEMKTVSDLKDRKKRLDSEMTGEIDGHLEILKNYSETVLEGGEEESVDCEIRYHTPTENFKQIVRLDTNEIVSESEMKDEDFNLFSQSGDFIPEQTEDGKSIEEQITEEEKTPVDDF